MQCFNSFFSMSFVSLRMLRFSPLLNRNMERNRNILSMRFLQILTNTLIGNGRDKNKRQSFCFYSPSQSSLFSTITFPTVSPESLKNSIQSVEQSLSQVNLEIRNCEDEIKKCELKIEECEQKLNQTEKEYFMEKAKQLRSNELQLRSKEEWLRGEKVRKEEKLMREQEQYSKGESLRLVYANIVTRSQIFV